MTCGDLPDHLEDLLHHPGRADDPLLVVLGVDDRLVLARRAQVRVHLKGVLDQGEHFLRIERLHHVVEGAVLHRLDGRLRRAEGGHQDDQLLGIGRANMLKRLDSAHRPHPDIEEHQVGRGALLDDCDPLFAACRLENAVIPGRKHTHERIPDLGVVIDDEDRGRLGVGFVHRNISASGRVAKVALAKRQSRGI